MGNGENNWINVENVSRDGNTLIFSDIHIETDGWLIIHPFQNGSPNGDRVVASAFLKAGTNKDVSIEVYKGLETGEMMIVMLHSDSNANGELDFIFVDAQNVMDRAVLLAHGEVIRSSDLRLGRAAILLRAILAARRANGEAARQVLVDRDLVQTMIGQVGDPQLRGECFADTHLLRDGLLDEKDAAALASRREGHLHRPVVALAGGSPCRPPKRSRRMSGAPTASRALPG